MSRQICAKCGGKLDEIPRAAGVPQIGGGYQTFSLMVCHPCQLGYDSDEFIAAVEVFLSGRKLPELEPVFLGQIKKVEEPKIISFDAASNSWNSSTSSPVILVSAHR